MILSDEDRIRILSSELEMLQNRFIKFDEIFTKSRGLAVALVSALVGWGLTYPKTCSHEYPLLLVVVIAVVVLFWLQEGTVRFAYVCKYAIRYRRLRDILNSHSEIDIPLYDLTNHIEGRPNKLSRIYEAFIRMESLLFYIVLSLVPLVLLVLWYF